MKLSIKNITHFLILFASIIFASIITGCGGSSGGGNSVPKYSGVTSPAVIDATNAEAIGTTATESFSQSVKSENSSNATPFGVTIAGSNNGLSQLIIDIAKNAAQHSQTINLPIGVTLTAADLGPNYCGGSITIPDGFADSSSLNGTITFNNLCFDDGIDGEIVMNGSVIFTETATSRSIQFLNITITITATGESATLNFTITCDSGFSCVVSSDYVGSDGATYRIGDYSVSGNASSGYTVTATFFHPVYGQVDVTTDTPVTFNCSTGNPDAGVIRFTSTNGTFGTITFNDCSSYTIVWSDGVGGGDTINGTW